MTLLGGSASGCQVSRFHKVKTQKAFERPKFVNDPAWRSASGCQVSRFHKVKTQKAFERPKFANDPAWKKQADVKFQGFIK
jgi:hypothetical protein